MTGGFESAMEEESLLSSLLSILGILSSSDAGFSISSSALL